jgi:hypothetical protein
MQKSQSFQARDTATSPRANARSVAIRNKTFDGVDDHRCQPAACGVLGSVEGAHAVIWLRMWCADLALVQ